MLEKKLYTFIFLIIFLTLIKYSKLNLDTCENLNLKNKLIKGVKTIISNSTLFNKISSVSNSIDCAKSCCLNLTSCDAAFFQESNCFHLNCITNNSCKTVKIFKNESESYFIRFEKSNKTFGFKKKINYQNQEKLNIIVDRNIIIFLPNNSITINATVFPKIEHCVFKWELIESPPTQEKGIIKNQNSPSLSLYKLKQGFYLLSVTVTSIHSNGEAFVNITVLPPKKINKPPVAIIQPENSIVQLPINEKILDGSTSTDDDKILSYKWDKIETPIGFKDLSDLNTATLKLNNLIAGIYKFQLTVKDSFNASSSAIANLTVLKEKDYPPTAVAGKDQIIYLPQNSVILNGSASSDDKKIVSWLWTLSEEEGIKNKPMNMNGVTTSFLNLSNLDVGNYKFILKVTDSSNQTSTAETHLFVKQQINIKPYANAGINQRIELPLKKIVILDGSKSKDSIQQKLKSWHWSQISGPKKSNILNPYNSVTNVTNLIPGFYSFKLEVTNFKNLTDSSVVNITIVKIKNQKPIAIGGGNQEIFGFDQLVILNGSRSYDDVEIVDYLWTFESKSLAAGTILGKSNHKSILKLINLVEGKYIFKLTVTDNQGAKGSDIVNIIVKNYINAKDYIRIVLKISSKKFLYEQLKVLINRIEILLNNNDSNNLKINNVKFHSMPDFNLVLLDFTINVFGKNYSLSTIEVIRGLRIKLRTDKSLINPEIISVNTLICQNNCSKHGICQEETKQCLCDKFWMQNFLRIRFGDLQENCDWSILYFILFMSIISLIVFSILWSLICFFIRRGPVKLRYRIRQNDISKKITRKQNNMNYSLLKNITTSKSLYNEELSSDTENEGAKFNISSKFQRKKSSKYIKTQSTFNHKDSSSDSEVVFDCTLKDSIKKNNQNIYF